MPWSNQSGGGGWKGGPGGPWGPRPGGPNQQPDLEEILRRGQDRIRQAIPSGRMGGPFAVMIAVALVALVGFFGFTVRVNPEELGVVLRFGEFVRLLPPGLNFRWPYPVEQVELPKVTRINRIEVGMRGSSDDSHQRQRCESHLGVVSSANCTGPDRASVAFGCKMPVADGGISPPADLTSAGQIRGP